KGVNVEIDKGDVICVIGPSGSGKSTFLRCLNLLETPTSGSILFEGDELTDKKIDLNRHRQKMGMVFQQFNLFPHMTVLDNLTCAPIMLKKTPKAEAEKKAMELLARVGLADRADAWPNQLSGGQKQRVAIVRALCNIQHHCPDDTFVLTDSDALDFCFKEFRSPVNYCRFASPFSSKYSTRTCPSDIITRHMYRESFKE
ncbi:glutamine transport ATP-binding protein GlnQ, partial [human gut metagenome]